MKSKRKKIPAEIEADVIFKSDRLCCVDQKRGDHIHHIDGDSSNCNFDNLALLCFDCHNEATISRSLRKKLSPRTIIKYRDHHYKVIQNQRNLFLRKLSQPIQKLTSEDLLNAAKDAFIIIEIEKLKHEYFSCRKSERKVILDKFEAFENHINIRIAYEILTFLVRVTYGSTNDVNSIIAQQIYFLAQGCLHSSKNESRNSEKLQLGIEALRISTNMFFSSVVYSRKLEITKWALLLVKNVYWLAKDHRLSILIEKVHTTFREFERQMMRQEIHDLADAKELLKIYKEDLSTRSLSFAPLPEHLNYIIENSK